MGVMLWLDQNRTIVFNPQVEVTPIFVGVFIAELMAPTFVELDRIVAIHPNIKDGMDTVVSPCCRSLTIAADGCLILLTILAWPLMSKPHSDTKPAHALFNNLFDSVLSDICDGGVNL